jgi:FeS assembly SUF system protein
VKTLPMIPTEPPRPEPSADPAPFVGDAARTGELREAIVAAISTVYDPEIPVNIWELGLVYDVGVDASGLAVVRMTLTAPNCPAAQSLPGEVAAKVKGVAGVSDARVDIVWDPPWSKDRMSEAAKLQLGMW